MQEGGLPVSPVPTEAKRRQRSSCLGVPGQHQIPMLKSTQPTEEFNHGSIDFLFHFALFW